MKFMQEHIFVAGTFDHLHKGHEAVLVAAFREGKQVTVGLTSDEFVKKFKKKTSALYDLRKQHLFHWLVTQKYHARAAIISIDDPYEPAASDPTLTALIVTTDNKDRGQEINTKRISRGLGQLALIEVALVSAEDTKSISSTRIRQKEIDPEGRLTLPDALRPELQKPLGTILINSRAIERSLEIHRNVFFITCGDMATITLVDIGLIPRLAIVDYKVERKPYTTDRAELQKLFKKSKSIISGPGYISDDALRALAEWGKLPKPLLLEIDGEEDLLTLPVIAAAPVGSVVYYGQPAAGLVEVVVTREKKRKVSELLKKFLME